MLNIKIKDLLDHVTCISSTKIMVAHWTTFTKTAQGCTAHATQWTNLWNKNQVCEHWILIRIWKYWRLLFTDNHHWPQTIQIYGQNT